jgi:hypothetical protein
MHILQAELCDTSVKGFIASYDIDSLVMHVMLQGEAVVKSLMIV